MIQQESKNPFHAFAFDLLKDDDFATAVEAAVKIGKERVEKIRHSPEPATFANTITALEQATEEVDFVAPLFNNLLGAHSTPKRQELAKVLLPQLSDFSSDLFLDEALFQRVKAVHDQPGELGAEDSELLRRTYRAFEANGVALPADKKERLKEIDRESTLLAQKYEEHGLEATKAFFLHLKSEAEWAGMPPHWVESAQAEAKKRGLEGAVVTLQYPSMGPFMMYADRRDLREKLLRASGSRCVGGASDNREIAKKLAALRYERAQLLGYESHAAYTVEDRMAEKPQVVQTFMDRIIARALPAAKKEIDELRKFSGLGQDFQSWDSSYWSEKLKADRLDFDEEALRPYLPLDAAFAGLKNVTEKLFGIQWIERKDIPVYHPEVQVFEILDAGRDHLGLLYVDLFPREEKRAGAWMTHFRDQGLFRGKRGRPHVSIVCSFTPPGKDRPSLLAPHELSTLFHETGHALHLLLSNTQHRTLAGTNVAWDFVELPSQLMEAWASEPEAVMTYARHYQTGEKPPRELLEKLKKTDHFLKGLFWVRQMTFADLDWQWHGGNPARFSSIQELEDTVRARLALLPKVEGTETSPFFSHIFAGGYSAGYYSYAWADVLAADAFEAFQSEGIFSSNTGKRLRNEVFAKGGSERPAALYRKFRGHDPDPDALFRREGLL